MFERSELAETYATEIICLILEDWLFFYISACEEKFTLIAADWESCCFWPNAMRLRSASFEGIWTADDQWVHEKLHQLLKPQPSSKMNPSSWYCITWSKLKLVLLPKQLITVTIRVRRWYMLGRVHSSEAIWRLKEILHDFTLPCVTLLWFVSCWSSLFVGLVSLMGICSWVCMWMLGVCVMHVLLMDECSGSDLTLLIWFGCWKELRLVNVCLEELREPACDKLLLSIVFSQV